MKKFLAPNLERTGRIVRGIGAVVLLVAGFIAVFHVWWAGAGLMDGGVFVLFEALRGWCVMRACGVKTRV